MKELGSVPAERYDEETLLRFVGREEYERFLASQGERLSPRMARSLALADLGPGMQVLDMGCGRGEIALHAAKRGVEVVGIDYSADCLRLSRRTLQVASEGGRARVALGRADATALPFADGAFDRVFMLDLVEHLYGWQLSRALRETHRVLSPKGYLILHTLPNRWALRYGYPLLRLLLPRLPRNPRTDYEPEVHVNEQDILSLKRSLDEAGLSSKVWLENLTVEQAAWHGAGTEFTDIRGGAYPFLRHPLVRAVVFLLMRTPLKLIVANDIYAIAWRPDGEEPQVLRGKGFRFHKGEISRLYISQTMKGRS